MTGRHARTAVALGLAAGDEAVTLAADTTVDPVLRRLVQRRLGKALLSAMSASDAAAIGADAAATAHTLRATALVLAGHRKVDLTSRDAVERAYTALPPVTPPMRAPWLTVLITLGAMTASAALVMWWLHEPTAPRRTVDRLATPARADAFTVGGRPLSNAGLQALLEDELPDYIVEVNRTVMPGTAPGTVTSSRQVSARTKLAAAPAIVALGPAVHAAWQGLVTAIGEWQALPGGMGMNQHFSDAARTFSAALATAGLGYYVDGDDRSYGDDNHELLTYTYQILDVGLEQAGPRTTRVLTLRRLDRLNIMRPVLGMQSKELGDPLVMLDQIEDEVATHELPVLGARGHYRLGDEAWERQDGDVPVLLTAVDLALRNETIAALGPAAARAITVGEQLTERKLLMGIMKTELRARGMRMGTMEAVFLPTDFFAQLSGRVDDEQLRPLHKIEDTLFSVDAAGIAAQVEDLVIASVRRHEAQHGLDDGATLAYPAELNDLVGPLAEGEWDRPFAQACQAELSAYLSQIASDPLTPQHAVWAMARHSFDASARGTSMSVVSTVVLLELARELGAPSTTTVWRGNGSLDRSALVPVALTIARAPAASLRGAAARVWTRLLGAPYVPVVDVARGPQP